MRLKPSRRAAISGIALVAACCLAPGGLAAGARGAWGVGREALPVTAAEGSVEAAGVEGVGLGIARPRAPRGLVMGALRILPPREADKTAYQGIVDEFGQCRPGNW